MKVTVDIDCSPEELRTFFGLPDVQPMQQAMMKEIEDRMKANLAAMDPETMVNTWLPQGMQNWDQMQKAFWGQFNAAGQTGQGGKPGKKSDKD
ncbi:DUF6489 family protein [Thalassospira lucentensis]|uniref:DUF6489 family protein n=1 Tax=Thalassospira lucentensis TaxID=168935 RepID=UPI0003B3A1A3|nr:DUF6489 family protein [Thalassospira lucentensis]RCK19699.1 hypothetical protein TH1_20735 [Thalassospira lucentensis MCCC 1A00383 = DSM 14000]|tara:strand:+ start:394 stop:672 length:279 start_codon:yes stop_codon:yes gene_type:complete